MILFNNNKIITLSQRINVTIFVPTKYVCLIADIIDFLRGSGGEILPAFFPEVFRCGV